MIVFVGSRGGVGATTTAVGCAWLLTEDRAESTALLDLDLHFGTVALKLDADPGSGLYEALKQPSRIDSLFIDRAMVKVTDNLRVLATGSRRLGGGNCRWRRSPTEMLSAHAT